jgi:hypothetical protein
MGDTITKYLKRQETFQRWPLHAGSTRNIDQVVVIPVLAEHPTLFDTLDDLAANPKEQRDVTLVICVVNNPTAPHGTTADFENNQRTLKELQHRIEDNDGVPLRLACIDATCGDNAIPVNEGVGLARKIGLDWGLKLLHENSTPDRPLISLDADTHVAPNYLPAISDFFDHPRRWAALLPYAHPLDGPRGERAAILCYELYLRYHTLGLAHADSPYAFYAIGSTITCTATAYAAIAGMRRRAAAEDFYFLEALAKAGPIQYIPNTAVHPAARCSTRTPFGTGQRVTRFAAGTHNEYTLYHPASYEIVKQWLNLVNENNGADAEQLLQHAHTIHPDLERFLREIHFLRDWEKICQNAPDAPRRLGQLHRWFDGLRTLRLIHFLRDNAYPTQPMFEAITSLLEKCGVPLATPLPPDIEKNLEAQRALLEHLRSLS